MGQYHWIVAQNGQRTEIIDPYNLGMPRKLYEMITWPARNGEREIDALLPMLLWDFLCADSSSKLAGRWVGWKVGIWGRYATPLDIPPGITSWKKRGRDIIFEGKEISQEIWEGVEEIDGQIRDGYVAVCDEKGEKIALAPGNIATNDASRLSIAGLIFLLAGSGDGRGGGDPLPYVDIRDVQEEEIIKWVCKVAKRAARRTKNVPFPGYRFAQLVYLDKWYRERRIVGRWAGQTVYIDRASRHQDKQDITPLVAAVATIEVGQIVSSKQWFPSPDLILTAGERGTILVQVPDIQRRQKGGKEWDVGVLALELYPSPWGEYDFAPLPTLVSYPEGRIVLVSGHTKKEIVRYEDGVLMRMGDGAH